ncbi:MAG TPA: hypothetical protein VGA13_02760 [Acidimicrobiales bacterium]
MTMDEAARHRLREAARGALGDEGAEALMTSLPPYDWHQIVTKEYLDHRLEGVETRLRGEIQSLRTELHSEIGALRGELHSEIGGLHSEIGGLRGELHGEIGGLRGELHGEIGGLRGELQMSQKDLATKVAGWIIAAFTANAAVTATLFNALA